MKTYELYCLVHKELVGIDLQHRIEIDEKVQGSSGDEDCLFKYKQVEQDWVE